jgi:hypothetical protein
VVDFVMAKLSLIFLVTPFSLSHSNAVCTYLHPFFSFLFVLAHPNVVV